VFQTRGNKLQKDNQGERRAPPDASERQTMTKYY